LLSLLSQSLDTAHTLRGERLTRRPASNIQYNKVPLSLQRYIVLDLAALGMANCTSVHARPVGTEKRPAISRVAITPQQPGWNPIVSYTINCRPIHGNKSCCCDEELRVGGANSLPDGVEINCIWEI
jgi:hypothetical protein